MIEINVAAKEVVKLSFGGKNGWPLHEHFLNDEDLEAKAKERAWLREKNAELSKKLDEIKCGPSCFSERQKAEDQIKALNLEIENLKEMIQRPISDAFAKVIDRAYRDFSSTKMMAWQPIETAPKDGTSLLLYHKHDGEFVGKWSKSIEKWCIAGGDGFATPGWWMRLPEAPI